MNDIIRIGLEVSVKSIALALCVGMILRAARTRSGSVCHAAWLAVLGGMMLMPLLSQLTPAVRLPVALSLDASEPVFGMPELPRAAAPRFALVSVPRLVKSNATARTTPAESRPRFSWLMMLLSLYLTGLAFLLASLAAGWRSARRILRTAKPVELPATEARVHESALVTTPVTVGIVSPRIVLPTTWHEWPEMKLRGVLAHEAAHVRRRDPLVSLAAHLNRCVFWFHPLAWWLERKLATTAEYSCDEAGVSAVGQGRAYAQVLLEMAGTVRRRGGRFSLAEIGMNGAGLLEERIDRILENDTTQSVSRTRKAVIAVGCAATIFAVAACRQRAATPSATKKQVELMPEVKALINARPSPVGPDLEKRLAEVRRNFEQQNDVDLLIDNATPLVTRVFVGPDMRSINSQTFAVGKAAIDRALQLDPKSTRARRAQIHAEVKALMDARGIGFQTGWRDWNQEEEQKRLASIRQHLEQSTDVNLLIVAATPMVSMVWPTSTGPAAWAETFAVGKAAIQRALQLDSKSAWARQLMNKIRDQELVASLPEKIWAGPLESRHEAIQALPDGERFRELSLLAYSAGDEAVRAEQGAPREGSHVKVAPDPAREKAFWAQAGKYAQEALDMSAQARQHADFGISLFRANMVAGMAAMMRGDSKNAMEFARKATDAPASEALQYPIVNARPWVMNWRFPEILVAQLLRVGERDTSADILERYSRLVLADRERLVADVDVIRKGNLPGWAHR